MRISDWSSDVCSSDLRDLVRLHRLGHFAHQVDGQQAVAQVGAVDAHEIGELEAALEGACRNAAIEQLAFLAFLRRRLAAADGQHILLRGDVDLVSLEARDRHRDAEMVVRSEEHTSELQSLMRTSYAVFCLKKKKTTSTQHVLTLKLQRTTDT